METPVQQFTPTAEQIAAAQALLAQAGTLQAQDTSSTGDQTATSTTVVIDEARKLKLTDLFNVSINDPKFWTNSKRLDRLEEALKVPLFDTRSLQGFATSAREELTAKALKAAIANKAVPVEPTEAEIISLAEQKYQDKLDKEAAKAAKKLSA